MKNFSLLLNSKRLRAFSTLAMGLGLALSGCSVTPEPPAPAARTQANNTIGLEEVIVIGTLPHQEGGGGSDGGGYNSGGGTGGEWGGGGPAPMDPGPGGGGDAGEYPSTIAGTNFKMTLNDQARYPRLTRLIKDIANFVNSDAQVLAALKQYTHLSTAQITQELKFGNGPTILVMPLGPKIVGEFSSKNPDALILNQAFVLGLEEAKLSTTIQATSFLLSVTSLHEYVHYGNFLVNFFPTDGIERGAAFERAGFTTEVNKNNAYEIYVNLFSN